MRVNKWPFSGMTPRQQEETLETIIPGILKYKDKDKIGNNKYLMKIDIWSFGRMFIEQINSIESLVSLGYRVSHPCPKCMGSNELPLCEVCAAGIIFCNNCNEDGIADYPGNYPCDECEEGWVNCDGCGGVGSWNCDECDKGWRGCEGCDGEGKKTCDECKGIIAGCELCEGSGVMYDEDLKLDVYCNDCEGGGVIICYTCGNTGKKECEGCNGRGKLRCVYGCDAGVMECEDCGAEGGWNCDNCYDGWIDCGECEDGLLDCHTCYGEWEGDICEDYWFNDDYHSYEAKQILGKYKNINSVERDNIIIDNLKNALISNNIINIRIPYGKDRDKRLKIEKTNIRKQIEPLRFKITKFDSYGEINLSKYKFNSVSFVFIADRLYPSIKKSKLLYTGTLYLVKSPTLVDSIKWRGHFLKNSNDVRWTPHRGAQAYRLVDKSKITIIETGLRFRDNLFVNWVNRNPMDVK